MNETRLKYHEHRLQRDLLKAAMALDVELEWHAQPRGLLLNETQSDQRETVQKAPWLKQTPRASVDTVASQQRVHPRSAFPSFPSRTSRQLKRKSGDCTGQGHETQPFGRIREPGALEDDSDHVQVLPQHE